MCIRDSALCVHHRAVVEVEHAAAHNGGRVAVIGELHGTNNRFRFANGVVVQKQRMRAGACLERLVQMCIRDSP